MSNKWSRRGVVTAILAAGILAGCTTGPLSGMMGGGKTQEVSLTGASEVPPAATSATGTGTVTINADHTVSVRVTVRGMEATAAHIHEGAVGANGPVVVPLTKRGDNEFVAPDGAKITSAQHESFKAGKLYLNVHSAKFPGGEVRAQLKGH